MHKTHIFPSEDTALAFMAGVDWVSDSAIEWVAGPTDQDGAWIVEYEDEDGVENLTFDHRQASDPSFEDAFGNPMITADEDE